MNINLLLELNGLSCALSSFCLNQWNQLKIHGFLRGLERVPSLSVSLSVFLHAFLFVFFYRFRGTLLGSHVQLIYTACARAFSLSFSPDTNRFVKFLVLLMILQLYGVDSFVAGGFVHRAPGGLFLNEEGSLSLSVVFVLPFSARRKGNLVP